MVYVEGVTDDSSATPQKVGGNKNELANGRLCRDALNEMHDERCGAGAMLWHGDL